MYKIENRSQGGKYSKKKITFPFHFLWSQGTGQTSDKELAFVCTGTGIATHLTNQEEGGCEEAVEMARNGGWQHLVGYQPT